MNKLFNFSKWSIPAILLAGLIGIYSCSSDDPEPEPTLPPSFTYSPSSTAVGTSSEVVAAAQGDPATFTFKSPDDVPDFITIEQSTGKLTLSEESTTGSYVVEVVATNEAGSDEASAAITITVNEDGFNPVGKSMLWRYWINNTEGVVMKNLNTLPGQEDLPEEIPLETGLPAEWPAVDPTAPENLPYFVLTGVQDLLIQVPGDEACAALDPVENGDTVLVVVNEDLTLSTICRLEGETGSTVQIGTSAISYAGGAYTWEYNTTLQGIPVTYLIDGAEIKDFTDPLSTFSAVQGNVAQYITPLDFADPLGSIDFLDVDVVLQVLE